MAGLRKGRRIKCEGRPKFTLGCRRVAAVAQGQCEITMRKRARLGVFALLGHGEGDSLKIEPQRGVDVAAHALQLAELIEELRVVLDAVFFETALDFRQLGFGLSETPL